MTANRVERHTLHQGDRYFDLILNLCYLSKNLYNHGNYVIRQELTRTGNWLRYQDLDRILKNDTDYPDYKAMPTASSAQQVLRRLDTDWKSFFALYKDYEVNSSKYNGCPKPPKYKPKEGYYPVIIYNYNYDTKLKDKVIKSPRVFRGFTIKPHFLDKSNFISYQYAEFKVMNKNKIQIDLIYRIQEKDKLLDNKNYLSIDLGINNLATIATNSGENAYAISGKPLKSINQYYNKQKGILSINCKENE